MPWLLTVSQQIITIRNRLGFFFLTWPYKIAYLFLSTYPLRYFMYATAIAEFNLGSNAYKSGKTDKAMKHFMKAMDSVFQGPAAGVDLQAVLFNRYILTASISCALARCYMKKAEKNVSYIDEVNQMLNQAKLYLTQSRKYQMTSKNEAKSKFSKQLKQRNEIIDSIYEITAAKMDLYWNNAASKIESFVSVLDNPTSIQALDTVKMKTNLLDKLDQLQAMVHDELNGALRQAKLLKSNGQIKNILNLMASFHERVADVFSVAYDDPGLSFEQEHSLEGMLTNYQFAFEALQSTGSSESNEQLLGLYRSVLNVLEIQSFVAERKGNLKQAIELCNELLKFTKKLDLGQFSQEQLADCKQEIADYTTNTQQRLSKYAKLNEQTNIHSKAVTFAFSQANNSQVSQDLKEEAKIPSCLPFKKRF